MDGETDFIKMLIQQVKKHRLLYDKRDAFYYNRHFRERAWKEVAEACGKNVADCKHRWKLLRERFGKEVKRMESPSGSGMWHLEEWKFLQPLMFLKESLARRRTQDNFDGDAESNLEDFIFNEDCSKSNLMPKAPLPKKSKPSLDSLYQRFGETIEKIEKSFSASEANTLDDAFLNTAGCLMKGLPDSVKEDFQSRMLLELYRLRRENNTN